VRSAAAIIQRGDGRVLLLQRGPTAPWMPNLWNLPGGCIEPGETPAQAAVRETAEETGLHVRALRPFTRTRDPDGYTLYVFQAAVWPGRVVLDHESQDFAWVPRESAYQVDLAPPLPDVLWRYAQ
jgi:mutator protein MutT